IKLSNNHPNILLSVQEMEHSKTSFRDLDFVVNINAKNESELQRTMVYFDTYGQASAAAEYLRSKLCFAFNQAVPPIAHYHADMSKLYKSRTMGAFKHGEIIILCATEAAGMGCDIRDISLVVQFGLPKTLCTWVQRLGRCSRDEKIRGEAILLVE
ncbi:hypothetical protein BS47DRAFT_1245535, partial [Hydnum rufescens UP504]